MRLNFINLVFPKENYKRTRWEGGVLSNFNYETLIILKLLNNFKNKKNSIIYPVKSLFLCIFDRIEIKFCVIFHMLF